MKSRRGIALEELRASILNGPSISEERDFSVPIPQANERAEGQPPLMSGHQTTRLHTGALKRMDHVGLSGGVDYMSKINSISRLWSNCWFCGVPMTDEGEPVVMMTPSTIQLLEPNGSKLAKQNGG